MKDIWFELEEWDDILKGLNKSAGINLPESLRLFDEVFTVKKMGLRAIDHDDVYDTLLVEIEPIQVRENMLGDVLKLGTCLGQVLDVLFRDNIFVVQYEV